LSEQRIGLYCRVSTEEQSINGFGLENQHEKLLHYCRFKGWTNLTWFEDSVSGCSMKRPGLKKLLRWAKSGKLDIVLTYRADRLSRKLSDLLRIIEDVFEPNEVIYISATEEFNTGSAIGKAFLSLLGTFSEFEVNAIRERTIGGKRIKASKGGYVTGCCPYGYRSVNKALVVDEEKAEIVREIYRMNQRGLSLNGIARELNRRGIEGAKGKRWYPAGIKYILNNPIYQGVLRQTLLGEIFETRNEELRIL